MKEKDFQNIIFSKKKLSKKSPLGKGISALLGEESQKKDTLLEHIQVYNIELDKCFPSKYQPRKTFNQQELESLADSIKEKGVIQPIVLREKKDSYEIIAGERRFRASKLLGLTTIPSIVLKLTDKEAMEIALIENLQREDLNVLEEAMAYKNLCDQFQYTHEEIGKTIGKNRTYVSNFLRILTLPKEVLELIEKKKLTAGHAKMLVSARDPIGLANEIVQQSLSVRELENVVKEQRKVSNKEKHGVQIPFEVKKWQDQSHQQYQKIKIKLKVKDSDSGVLNIEYSSLSELKKILNI